MDEYINKEGNLFFLVFVNCVVAAVVVVPLNIAHIFLHNFDVKYIM